MPARWGFPDADPGSRACPVARDTSDMRARLTSTHFVGRVGELAELELAWAEADAGRPVLVLLGGESGMTGVGGPTPRTPQRSCGCSRHCSSCSTC
jgi:hypothetical protein